MILQTHYITDELLFNSVTIQLADMSTEAFLSPLFQHFQQAVALILNSPKENIVIFSVQVWKTWNTIPNIFSKEKKTIYFLRYELFPYFFSPCPRVYLYCIFFIPLGMPITIFFLHPFHVGRSRGEPWDFKCKLVSKKAQHSFRRILFPGLYQRAGISQSTHSQQTGHS